MKKFTISCLYCKETFEVKLPAEIEAGKLVAKSNMFKAKCIKCSKIFIVKLPTPGRPGGMAKPSEFKVAGRPQQTRAGSRAPLGARHPGKSAPVEPREEVPMEVPVECITELAPSSQVRPLRPPQEPLGGRYELSRAKVGKNEFWTKPKLAAVILVFVFILGIGNAITNIVYTAEIAPDDATIANDASSTVTISGTVMDFDTTVPIGDARVNILGTGHSTVTNTEGFYVLENVPEGEHTISVYASGYKTLNKKITLTLVPERMIDFELEKGSGTVITDDSSSDTGLNTGNTDQANNESWNFIGYLILLFSISAIFSAYLAYNQFMFWLCGLTAFIAIFSIGFGIGIFLGIIALMLILVSKDIYREFQTPENSRDN